MAARGKGGEEEKEEKEEEKEEHSSVPALAGPRPRTSNPTKP